MSGRASVVLFALLFACGKGDKPPPPSSGRLLTQETGPSTQQGGNDPSEAQQMFASTCAMCHGMSGKGDGMAAKDFAVKPRDYTDPKWQASVTDEDIKKTILLGGKGVGKSPLMPDFGSQLRGRTDVLDGLVKIIRSFGSGGGKPPGHP